MATVPAAATAAATQRIASSSRSPGVITRRVRVRHGLDEVSGLLHIGAVAVPLQSVVRYRAAGLSEKDLSTAFATIAIFSFVAAAQTFLVLEAGWRAKFLVESVLFGGIAVCATAELFSARRSTMFTFNVWCADGQQHTFSTADRAEAEALKQSLDAAGAVGH
jgi:hypothetical protein